MGITSFSDDNIAKIFSTYDVHNEKSIAFKDFILYLYPPQQTEQSQYGEEEEQPQYQEEQSQPERRARPQQTTEVDQ